MDCNNFLYTFTEMMLPFLFLVPPLPPDIFIVAYVQVTCHKEATKIISVQVFPGRYVSPQSSYTETLTPNGLGIRR